VPVTTTVWVVITAPDDAVKVELADPAGIATEAGTARAELFAVTEVVMPPEGAGELRAMVQVVEVPDRKLAGLHASPETATAVLVDVTLTEVVTELPGLDAVSVAV